MNFEFAGLSQKKIHFTFKQSEQTIAAIRMFLKVTSLREIGLSNCRLHLPAVVSENIFVKAYECSSMVVLRLAGTQVYNFERILPYGDTTLIAISFLDYRFL